MQENEKRSAREIFADIPFPLKIVVVVGSIFIVFVICYVTYLTTIYEPKKERARIIAISGSPVYAGLLDPSVASNGTNRIMAYTSVSLLANGSFGTEVMLSQGQTNCMHWTPLTSKMELRPDTLIGPDLLTPVAHGAWRAETPSLVYDPADAGREWKLFAYRYFWSGSAPLARLYSVIVMRYASNPLDADWSREQWILSANDKAPPEPYANLTATKLNPLHPDLLDVYFYARPSVVNVDNVLVMSLSAFVQGKDSPDRIILLASTDHARSWRYLGTALRERDLAGMGAFTRLTGGSLFMKDKTMYLSAMLGTEDSDAVGAHILEFENASTASLRRDARNGSVAILNYLPTQKTPPSRLGGGALAYNDDCPRKTFMSESLTGQRHDIFVHPVSPVN
ncbi:MAG: hypothetical protein Q8K65_05465 [Alphaproteobacteria bacterium]|nr:hypothetical protein [Alphaproteobacteria bacterium]